jgi:hypothetical protein
MEQANVPSQNELTVCFAHVAYQIQAQFARRGAGIASFQAWSRDELDARIGEADVLVISGLWRNDLIERAKKLRFIQSIGAGTDQFSRELLSAGYPAGKRPRRECPGGLGACYGAHPGARAAAAGGARQSGQASLARHDRRPHAPGG